MLVDYAVTEMGCFDDYSDNGPHSKTMRVYGITNFILHVSQCIIFNQTKFVTSTIIANDWLKSLYSRLCYKIIKDFTTSTNFKEACKQFHYESGKSNLFQKQTIGLQCYLTISWRVKVLNDNQIDKNKYSAVYKYLNEVSPSDYWFSYEYIDAEVNKNLGETKGRLAGYEMKKEIKSYVDSINHDPNWLKKIIIEIDKLLINPEYINFFTQVYMQ